MRGVEMVLSCGGRHGGHLICFVLGLSSCLSRMVRAMTRTVPALSSVLLQMQFQTHHQYPMSMTRGSAVHNQDGKQVWPWGPPPFPGMLAMLAMLVMLAMASLIPLPIQA